MRHKFSVISGFLALAALGPYFQTAEAASKDWRDQIAQDSPQWRVESYEEGDLNWDGRRDVVAVTSRSAGPDEKRQVWIFLKKKDGGYKRHTKTENWPGAPSLHPVGVVWTENPEDASGNRTFKWQLDPGRNKFYLIEETASGVRKINYQTHKMFRPDAGESLVVCRVDPKKSQVSLDRFNPAAHPADPSIAKTCVDPTLTLEGEDADLLRR